MDLSTSRKMSKIKDIVKIIVLSSLITTGYNVYFGNEEQIISEKKSLLEEIQLTSLGGHDSAMSEDDDTKNEHDDATNVQDDATKEDDEDDGGIVHSSGAQLWPDDPICSSYTVGIPKQAHGSWLLTAPRSGTDWTLYLLEAATGKCSSTVYLENGLQPLGFCNFEVKPNSVPSIITKTHRFEDLRAHPFWPVVIVIRNPMRSIVSYYNFERIKNATVRFTGSIDKKSYGTKNFRNFARSKLKKWLDIYTYALKHRQELHVVYYEYLRENPLEEIRKILQFLKLNIDEERLFCVARHLEGYRKGAQRAIMPYSWQVRRDMRLAIKRIDKLLELRGFPSLPEYRKFNK